MQTRTGMGAWIGALLLLTVGHSAWAANATWIGATDGTWATDANWSVPPAPGTGNTATFNNAGNGNTTLDLGGGVTVKTVLFDTTNAAAYTIGSSGAGSQTITLNDLGAITINSTVTNNQGVDANLTLGTATASSYTLTSGSAGRTLTLAGKVQGGTGGTAAAKTLSVAGAGNTTISGVITNGGASSLALSKTGSGTLILSAINTYTGNTTAGGGVLRADYGIGLPSATGVLYLNGSGVLETSGTITRNLGTGAGNIAFSGSGGFAARGGALGVTLNSGATLTAGSTGSFMGQGASLVLGSSSADSVLTLSNSLDYAANPGSTWGGLNVIHNTGIPLVQDKAVLNGGLRFTGNNSGTSNGWQKYGNGRLEITGAGASGGVNVLVSEGVLALTGSGDLSTYRGVWSSGGGFEIAGGAANTAKTIQILGLSSGTDMPGTVVSTAYGGPGTFTLIPGAGVGLRLTAASVSRGAGAVVLFRGPGLGTASYPSADLANLVVTTTSGLALTGGGGGGGAGSTTINIVPYAIGDNSATGSGSDFVTHTTNGIRLLSAGASEYKTTIDDGQTALDNVNLTGAQTLSVPTTINALRLDNGGSVGGTGGSLTINSGATLALAGNGGLSVGTLAYGAKEAVFTTLGDLAVSSALTGSGGLAKSGSGTMTLSGAYGITGTAVVSAGALVAGAVNALPSTLKLSPGALVDAAGYNQTVAALTGHALGVYTNSGAAITLTVNAPTSTTMGPTFWGAMDIVKTGAGTYGASPSQLSNTGALTVNAGTF